MWSQVVIAPSLATTDPVRNSPQKPQESSQFVERRLQRSRVSSASGAGGNPPSSAETIARAHANAESRVSVSALMSVNRFQCAASADGYREATVVPTPSSPHRQRRLCANPGYPSVPSAPFSWRYRSGRGPVDARDGNSGRCDWRDRLGDRACHGGATRLTERVLLQTCCHECARALRRSSSNR